MASDSRRRDPKFHEGPPAADRFDSAMSRILSVPKAELAKREADYQKSRADKDRPGPRRRTK
jgi:hypothetical protein